MASQQGTIRCPDCNNPIWGGDKADAPIKTKVCPNCSTPLESFSLDEIWCPAIVAFSDEDMLQSYEAKSLIDNHPKVWEAVNGIMPIAAQAIHAACTRLACEVVVDINFALVETSKFSKTAFEDAVARVCALKIERKGYLVDVITSSDAAKRSLLIRWCNKNSNSVADEDLTDDDIIDVLGQALQAAEGALKTCICGGRRPKGTDEINHTTDCELVRALRIYEGD